MPKPNAKGKSPLLVSKAMAVVMTRVKPSMLPPTTMTAPTSDTARPNAANTTVSKKVEPYTIVAGFSAKPVGQRVRNLNYKVGGRSLFAFLH